MTQVKINDLTLASNITSSMQLETDLSGTTANKINIEQLTNYLESSLTVQISSKYIDFVNGSDTTGDGSIFNPWQSLQYAYDSISPTRSDPITLFLAAQINSVDTGTITGKPNVNLIALGGVAVIPYDIVISGGSTNDIVYFSNLIIQGSPTSITWTRNDTTFFQMYLFNVATYGTVIFEQQGAGIISCFLAAYYSTLAGYTVTAGQLSLFLSEIYGTTTYNDSGAAFFQMVGGNNGSAMTFNGGITAEFSGVFSDIGYSIDTVTTGSGTPTIQTDSGSIPASITGSGTITLISNAQHEAYSPAVSGNWSPAPAQVADALDQLAARLSLSATANLNFGTVNANTSSDLTISLAGAQVGDVVALGAPSVAAGIAFTAFVSATDTITVRAANVTTGNISLSSANFTVKII